MKQKQDSEKGSEDKSPSRHKGEETIGEILLGAREDKGLTIEKVSQETKIPPKMLEYLETDNFEAVPAKVYVKGFLRTYAGMLGLDAEHILNKYEVQSGQTHTTKGDHWEIETDVIEEKLRPPKIFRNIVLPAILIVVLIIVFSRIGCQREREVEPPPPLPDLQEETQKEQGAEGVEESKSDEGGTIGESPDQGGNAAEDDRGPSGDVRKPSESAEKTTESETEPSKSVTTPSEGAAEPAVITRETPESTKEPQESVPEPDVTKQETSGSTQEPSVSTREPTEDAPSITVDESPDVVFPLELHLTANETDSTWFDLLVLSTVDERQEGTVYDFILFPGQTRSFKATDAFVFREISNAGGFTMELNGKRLQSLGEKGEVINNIWITSENLSGDQ